MHTFKKFLSILIRKKTSVNIIGVSKDEAILRKRRGPRTDPCGTPPWNVVFYFVLNRYTAFCLQDRFLILFNSLKQFPFIPQLWGLVQRISWLAVSGFDRPTNILRVYSPFSKYFVISFNKFKIAF